MKSKKGTSIAKIEASRKNALKSTGPKTPKGKSVVKWNALKHGLLSKEIVIPAGDGEENDLEFKALLSQLRTDLQPVGVLEEMLVEKIAVCYWRLRRVLRSEVGEIRKDLDTVSLRETFRRADEVAFEKRFLDLDNSRQKLMKNSMGIMYLIGVLDDIKKDVKEVGYLSEESLKKLILNFGGEENGLGHWCFVFSKMAIQRPEDVKKDPEKFGKLPNPEQCTKMILKLLDDEKKQMERMKEIIKEHEELELEAKTASLSLPTKEVVDKILRYETTIERQLYRAMSQLERLQRQRKGEIVPPPLNVEVSSEK